MATNFGSKIAINAYKCISMRDSSLTLINNAFMTSVQVPFHGEL